MNTIYKSPPVTEIELDGQPIQVPSILTRPDEGKKPLLAKLMMALMPILMLGMVAFMITSGIFQNNPMMMMMPVMMIGMMAMMLSGGLNPGASDMGQKIMWWLLDLRESRKQVHTQAQKMFEAQRTFFPQPQILYSLIGRQSVGDRRSDLAKRTPRMWTVGYGKAAGIKIDDPEQADGLTYNPYMAPRIGVGTTLLDPKVQVDEQQVQEAYEPVSYAAYTNFMRKQRFVTDIPIAYDLKKSPFYQFDCQRDTDYEPARALTRAMVANLAFNHSPTELQIVLVTKDPDSENWASMKWLPHCHDRTPLPSGDSRRLIYRSLDEFWAASAELRGDRGIFNALTPSVIGAAANTATAPNSKVLVIVDIGDGHDDSKNLPMALDRNGVGDMTFLWIGRAPVELGVAEEATLYLEDKAGMASRKRIADPVLQLSTGTDYRIARADQMTVAEFDLFARTMSGYRPRGWHTSKDTTDTTAAVETERVQTFLEALGISGPIEEWNPVITWNKREASSQTVGLLGNELDDKASKTSQLVDLDLAETAKQGTGPSGTAQGKTGSGKSYLLRGLVLSLLSRYSPERLNFLLMDFKGGATFLGYDALPHVQAVVTNLEEERHLLVRMQKVVRGELERRQELLRSAEVVDIDAYRDKRLAEPELNLPPLPNLMVVADEFREFIQENREFLKLFESIAQTGRSLGMHLLLVSQYIDESIIGGVKKNLTYGVSLAVDDQSNSQAVIRSPAAADLPVGTGDAYVWKSVPNGLTKFRSFDIEQRYTAPTRRRPVSEGEDADLLSSGTGRGGLAAVREAMESADGASVALFTSTDIVGEEEAELAATGAAAQPPEKAAEEVQVAAGAADKRPTMEKAVLNRLKEVAQETGAKAPHTMWLPTTSRPLTFAEVDAYADDRTPLEQATRLQLTVGILDNPRKHERRAYNLILDGPGAHIRVAGDRGTGVSTTIEAIIAAAASQAGPDVAQFYIIDAGNKLAEMMAYPNVGMYTRASSSADDTERIDRLLGEFSRVIAIRQAAMEARGMSSFGSYWERKQNEPVAGDPYGHMVLVIDHANVFFNEDDEYLKTRQNRLIELLTKGGPVGVHVIVGSGGGNMNYKVDPLFTSVIHHKVADVGNTSITYQNYELKNEIKAMPSGEPGRVFDLGTELEGRIMQPHNVELGPDYSLEGSKPNNPKWNYQHDWREQTQALGAELSRQWTSEAPSIHTVAKVLSPAQVWQHYEHIRQSNPQAYYMHPLGISAEDLSLVGLPDTAVDVTASPNLILAGDRAAAGKTTAVRSGIRWIKDTYTRGEAIVYMFDTGMQLMEERDHLKAAGLLGAYISSRGDVDGAMKKITEVVRRRMPTNGSEMTRKQIQERSWWSGPEIFVIIDPGAPLIASGYGASAVDELSRMVSERNDIGTRIWMTLTATDLQTAVQSRRAAVENLIEGNANVMLFSGSVQGTVFGSLQNNTAVKFVRRRPGLAQLYNPQWAHYPIVQVPNEEPWPELELPTQQP